MATITIDVENAPMSAIDDALAKLLAEQARRNRAANLKGQIDMIGREVDAALGRVDGAPWVRPIDASTAYARVGATVTHPPAAPKTWTNLIPFNTAEPGVGGGWREKVADGQVAAYVQPLGALDTYAKGAKVKWTDGKVYVSLVNFNVQPPTVATHWVLDAPTGTVPAFVPGKVYAAGDLMTFGGFTWKSKINANVWSPTDYPAGWEKVS